MPPLEPLGTEEFVGFSEGLSPGEGFECPLDFGIGVQIVGSSSRGSDELPDAEPRLSGSPRRQILSPLLLAPADSPVGSAHFVRTLNNDSPYKPLYGHGGTYTHPKRQPVASENL